MNLLKRYEFTSSSTVGIKEISGDIPGLRIDPKGIVSFASSLSDIPVEIWNDSGTAQSFVRNGNYVDFRNLPSDVYVVKIGHVSVKILKK